MRCASAASLSLNSLTSGGFTAPDAASCAMRSIAARVRHAPADGAIGRDAVAVGADERPLGGDDGLDVVLGDRGHQHARCALVVDEIVAERVDRVGAALLRQLQDGAAGMLRQVW